MNLINMMAYNNHLTSRNHNPTRISIHHTAGGEAGLIPTMRRTGFFYHYAITEDGRVMQFEDPHRITHHTRNNNNGVIGIAFIGNFVGGYPTKYAVSSLRELIAYLYGLFGDLEVLGHNEFPGQATKCPGLDMDRLRGDLTRNTSEVSEWARSAREWVILNGISDGQRPRDMLTRQELWTMLYRMAGDCDVCN